MFTTSGGQTVSCITDNADGTITLRLLGPVEVVDGKPTRTSREVLLLEPTAREYAQLRERIVTVDRQVRDMFPAPEPPTVTPDTPEAEARAAVLAYQEAAQAAMIARRDYVKGEDTSPYGACVIEVARRLGGVDITLDDLPAEALEVRTCTALLEVWEAPLGGPVVPPAMAALVEAATATADPEPEPEPESTSDTAPDSPATEASSPPGTEPSTP